MCGRVLTTGKNAPGFIFGHLPLLVMWSLISPCIVITGRKVTDATPGCNFFEMDYPAYKAQRQKGLRPIFLDVRQNEGVIVLFDPSDPEDTEIPEERETAQDVVTSQINRIGDLINSDEGMATTAKQALAAAIQQLKQQIALAASGVPKEDEESEACEPKAKRSRKGQAKAQPSKPKGKRSRESGVDDAPKGKQAKSEPNRKRPREAEKITATKGAKKPKPNSSKSSKGKSKGKSKTGGKGKAAKAVPAPKAKR
jgi:hypothetical protein